MHDAQIERRKVLTLPWGVARSHFERQSARAPERQSARAPERQSARAPERQSARAPERQSARAPERQSARAPERQSARAPERQSARAPERQSARAPERQSARAPERQSARAPERQSARAPRGVVWRRASLALLAALSLFAAAPAVADHQLPRPTNPDASERDELVDFGWRRGGAPTTQAYEIQYGEHSSSTLATIEVSSSDSPVLRYHISGLTNGTTYRFRVRSKGLGDHDSSDWTEYVTATPAGGPPAKPTGVDIRQSDTQLTVSWSRGAFGDGTCKTTIYDVRYKAKGSSASWTSHVHFQDAASNSYTIANLASGTYSVQVQGWCDRVSTPSGWTTAVVSTPSDTPDVQPQGRPTVSFPFSTYSMNEGDSLTITVNVNPPLTENSNINITMDKGGAREPFYFSSTLWANKTSVNAGNFSTSEDPGRGQPPREITFVLSAVSNAPYDLDPSAREMVVTIHDTTEAPRPGVAVSPDSLNVVAGGTATYTVELQTPPSHIIWIPLTVGDPDKATVSAIGLIFYPHTWNIGQTVTVTGVSAGSTTISHGIQTDDLDYLQVNLPSVAITVAAAEQTTEKNKKSGGDPSLELVGTNGPDTLEGTGGKETLIGKRGDDVLRGMGGKDELRGGKDDDELRGGKGADKLFGGDGDDTLIGGQGADRLMGGNGHDTLTGGPGADRFVFGSDETGDNIITDFGNGNDRIVLKTESDPWPSLADIIAGVVAQGDRYLVYTLLPGLTVETHTPLRVENFEVK